MTGFPNSPKLLRAGIVTMSPDSGAVERIISLQYAPETLSRSLAPQLVGGQATQGQAVRYAGAPQETITLQAVLDATDQLEFPDQNAEVAENGLHAALAALETLLYPASAQLEKQKTQLAAGSLQIAPLEAPLALFVWSAKRIVPVMLENLQITEQFFDANLNPIRADLNLTLKVLSVNDLGFGHRGAGLFMAYLKAKEGLAQKAAGGTLETLGAGGSL